MSGDFRFDFEIIEGEGVVRTPRQYAVGRSQRAVRGISS
jgi:hypothetical protein